ncbi:MAG: cytochrome c biogenesis protein CcsA [Candidatus Omnitrophica bacterium]|nr:cytochrome c biogenesis protein CcsA [Candidatus Omnitrophota bacterium]
MSFAVYILIFLGYFASFVCYGFDLVFEEEGALLYGKRLLFSSLLAHGVSLVVSVSREPRWVAAYFSESLYLVSFLLVLLLWILERRFGVRFFVLFSLPVVLLLYLLAVLSMGRQGDSLGSALFSKWLWIHTGFIWGGLAGFVAAVSCALMYLFQSWQLKSKRWGKLFVNLPSLQTLDRFHFAFLSIGAILFSLGILGGLFWAKEIKEMGGLWRDPKVFLSFLTCAVYWSVLGLRLSSLRRGQKIAAGTVLVFGLLFVTLMSSTYAPSGFHAGF